MHPNPQYRNAALTYCRLAGVDPFQIVHVPAWDNLDGTALATSAFRVRQVTRVDLVAVQLQQHDLRTLALVTSGPHKKRK